MILLFFTRFILADTDTSQEGSKIRSNISSISNISISIIQSQVEKIKSTPGPVETSNITISNSSLEQNLTICKAPHTRLQWGNKCICEEGYFGTDEQIQTTGCYTCKKRCHHAASCVEQDTCKCKRGLVGDGIQCSFPEPKIKQVLKPFEKQLAPVNVLVEFDAPEFIPYLAFCKINSKTVPALIYNNQTIACLSPDKQRGEASISISYDGKVYSPSQKYTIVPGLVELPKPAIHLGIQPKTNNWIIPSIIGFGILVCIVLYFILHIFNGKIAIQKLTEERQPLISNKGSSNHEEKRAKRRDI
ncbi:hypothetical protein TVAG_423060 [Trichomonas vaginalis G3]|uniref:EGF-like domain-containing protein n=1 Tax=Trichomonas vaginalis (strain ATCC PRA-98 / G3) TaxID=412133 RepID=A2DTE5_TRIV3|nr:laminin domain-containing protein [Trichomonas vaginalis G3]EAY16254.1 hypothetical protein TVAG_423060 [Trichomonas vaginalis G3]KAI5523393.1 laminin domain-containing protein [Trichomonas vaginalis G3]|eukprot:XP_001328477.1 hypothetical protein [Trichomonas vaginalis G3]